MLNHLRRKLGAVGRIMKLGGLSEDAQMKMGSDCNFHPMDDLLKIECNHAPSSNKNGLD